MVIPDEEGRILMVCQEHEGNRIWMLPGGGIEQDENAAEAAEREVLEETGLRISVKDLLWHIEEVSPARGQRFVNFFLADLLSGTAKLGMDPEFEEKDQVLRELSFFSCEEIEKLPRVYPAFLKEELPALGNGKKNNVFRLRESI